MLNENTISLKVRENGFVQKLKSGLKKIVAQEIFKTSKYHDQSFYLHPYTTEESEMYLSLPDKNKIILQNIAELPDLTQSDKDCCLILDGVFNYSRDIHGFLTDAHKKLNRHSKILAICYNPYLKFFYTLLSNIGLRNGPLPTTFFKKEDLIDLVKTSEFEVTRFRDVGLFPFYLFGMGKIFNGLLSLLPIVKIFNLVSVITLRPIVRETEQKSVSIVIPARNEKGNIENALKRIPTLNAKFVEVIFVEGHSNDHTWDEIQRVIPLYSHKFVIKSYKQMGKGKIDAVRVGFSHATGDILTILDADLTMPPEMLPRYIDAYLQGLGNFINGSRLLYEMEGEAMRFLNKLGNIFFAKSLSFVLQTRLGDSLCGTKLLSRKDYQKIISWRQDFGDFDPFGDFELLFPASTLGLGILNIPIRYLARTYGTTNISRFYHGAMLAKMTLIGLTKIRL